jgi:holo-[acyl-carrier protein] synthase
MPLSMPLVEPAMPSQVGLRVGIDVVQISRVAESLERFGERFMRRLFTADEIAYANQAPRLVAERLAARFAAKEAALKAFDLGQEGVDWRDIEVRKLPGGACRLALHGKAAALAAARGADEIAISLSHDGDYATAIVTSIRHTDSSTHLSTP